MSIVQLDLPQPPPGESWCLVCAMLLKADVTREHESEIETALADGKNDRIRLIRPNHQRMPLRPAAVRGVCAEMAQLGLIDLCWDHLSGATVKQPGLLTTGGLPPGLIRRGRG